MVGVLRMLSRKVCREHPLINQGWKACASEAGGGIGLQVTVPESTLLAVHTLHFPRLREGPHINGQFEHRTITRWAHVAQLNAAMRHLAAKHRLQVCLDPFLHLHCLHVVLHELMLSRSLGK